MKRIAIFALLFSLCFCPSILLAKNHASSSKKNCHKDTIPFKGCCSDYIIVGSGSAGAMLALRLTDDGAKDSVLTLEWGLDFRGDPALLFLSGFFGSVLN